MITTPHAPIPATPQPIDCDTTVRRLWDYLDEELDTTRYAEVAAHVADCQGCAAHFDFSRAFLGAVTEHWEQTPDAAALRERVARTLAEAGFTRP